MLPNPKAESGISNYITCTIKCTRNKANNKRKQKNKSTILISVKCSLDFTKGNDGRETCDGSMNNFTVGESNNHNYKGRTSLNHNSNAQRHGFFPLLVFSFV
jgi:hypothetical protein